MTVPGRFEMRWGDLARTAAQRVQVGWWDAARAERGSEGRGTRGCLFERPRLLTTGQRVQFERATERSSGPAQW